jgi:hypothetical protein
MANQHAQGKSTTPAGSSKYIYELDNTRALVNYLHKAMFSPTKSALLQVVKNGHLITWPGLTEQAIHKHLKLTPDTTMGNMNQPRHNMRSTSKTPITSGPRGNRLLWRHLDEVGLSASRAPDNKPEQRDEHEYLE